MAITLVRTSGGVPERDPASALAGQVPKRSAVPGLLLCAAGVAGAAGIHQLLGSVAMLTIAVVLGVAAANLNLVPSAARYGLSLAAKHAMRAGVVLLGLQVAFGDILDLGWQTVAVVLVVMAATFAGTQWLGRRLGLSSRLSLLVATGFSVCGASAVAAANGALGSRDDDEEASRDTVTAIALVTLCGSLAIAVLPALGGLLGLSEPEIGRWAGASVHDVGQVVATASVAGSAALAPAVAVKLIRIAMLAPIVSGIALRSRRDASAGSKRPPVLPLFVAGFLALVALRATGWVPADGVEAAKVVQDLAFAAGLFALCTAVRLRELARTGHRALLLGLTSWALIAGLSCAGIMLTRGA